MNVFKYIAVIICLGQVLSAIPVINVHAEDTFTNSSDVSSIHDQALNEGIQFLRFKQDPTSIWDTPDSNETSFIVNIAEYLYDYSEGLDSRSYYQLNEMIMDGSDYYLDMKPLNNDTLSRIILINDLRMENICEIYNLLRSQNPDGGFGLAEGYTSDIIDTKLALKALTDIGETEAMTNAALYISSLQNEDGGFGYQQGLSSNAYLSAEIADILVDTVDINPVLSYYLEDTFTALDEYLDSVFPAISELSENNLDQVYQHFYTALYRLKRDGRYDVTPYYDLQAEDGGVFDDPMATALFLELLVKEQNALVAKLDTIAITNDRGYAVSAFNSNENVNISVLNEYENEKAYLAVSIITPDGTVISLDGENSVWNTADYADGKYTVRAEIIRTSNDEVVTSLEQTFRIQHRLAVDSITLALSQPYSRVGDTDSVEIIAEFDISNFSEDNQLAINWTVTDVSGELIEADTVNISEADVAMNSILLGSFIPDTSERNAYIIKAELM